MTAKFDKLRARTQKSGQMGWLLSIGVMLFLLGVVLWGRPNNLEVASKAATSGISIPAGSGPAPAHR